MSDRSVGELWHLFQPLWDDQDRSEDVFKTRPLLAHYTSLASLEKIAISNELWFSNPLFMNDVEEVRFRIDEGMKALLSNAILREAFGDQYPQFTDALLIEHGDFWNAHAPDTYVFCFSQYDPDRTSGLLSMWRGYGDAGRGAAVVIDTSKIGEQVSASPLIFAKVYYGTQSQRKEWFSNTAVALAQIVTSHNLSDKESARLAGKALFARLRLFSLFSKHDGFSEEREWRIAYLPERDASESFRRHLSYFNGPRGIEPKLKLQIEPMPELGNQPLSLEALVSSIILGPSISSYLSIFAAKRMLEGLGRPLLAERVRASNVPFRPG